MNTRKWMVVPGSVAVVVVAVTLLAALGAQAKGPEGKKGILDGRVFDVKLTEDGKAPMPDRLSFEHGKLVSAELEKNGFPPEPYEAKGGVDTIKFTAKMKSKKDGEAKWEGTLVMAGDHIGGEVEWNKKGEKPAKYEFSGTEVKDSGGGPGGAKACKAASDCQGILPHICKICADGKQDCAHFACEAGQCVTALCPADKK